MLSLLITVIPRWQKPTEVNTHIYTKRDKRGGLKPSLLSLCYFVYHSPKSTFIFSMRFIMSKL